MRTLTLPVPAALSLPKIILGTAFFGTHVDTQTSMTLMDAYAEQGGTCLDTARVYGDWEDKGISMSEEVIGQWLKQSSFRSKMKIITKGAHYRIKTPDISRVQAKCIEEDIEKSLKTLDVEAIDLYFLHRDNPLISISDIVPVLHKFVQAGKLKAIGASNWSLKRILEANAFALQEGMTPFSASEIQWTLADIVPEEDAFSHLPYMTPDVYEEYLQANIPVLAWSPQASGVFSVLAQKGLEGLKEGVRKKYVTPLTMRRFKNLQKVFSQEGISPTQAVLGYITCNSLPAAAVIGPSSLGHLQDSLSAANIELSSESVLQLTE